MPHKGERTTEQKNKAGASITYMPTRYLLPLTAVFTAAFLGIAWILINFTDSNVPWLDSFTTAMSIIACGCWHGNMWNNVGMDCGGCSEHRAVHTTKDSIYGRTIRPFIQL